MQKDFAASVSRLQQYFSAAMGIALPLEEARGAVAAVYDTKNWLRLTEKEMKPRPMLALQPAPIDVVTQRILLHLATRPVLYVSPRGVDLDLADRPVERVTLAMARPEHSTCWYDLFRWGGGEHQASKVLRLVTDDAEAVVDDHYRNLAVRSMATILEFYRIAGESADIGRVLDVMRDFDLLENEAQRLKPLMNGTAAGRSLDTLLQYFLTPSPEAGGRIYQDILGPVAERLSVMAQGAMRSLFSKGKRGDSRLCLPTILTSTHPRVISVLGSRRHASLSNAVVHMVLQDLVSAFNHGAVSDYCRDLMVVVDGEINKPLADDITEFLGSDGLLQLPLDR